MKLKKRIAAMGAAMIMAGSMMNIGASAASKQAFHFNIYYKPLAPSSAIKISQSGYYPKSSKLKAGKQIRIVYSHNVNNSDVKVRLVSGKTKYIRYYSKKRYGDYDVFNVKPKKRYKVKSSLYNYTNRTTYACKGWVEDN